MLSLVIAQLEPILGRGKAVSPRVMAAAASPTYNVIKCGASYKETKACTWFFYDR